jgi:hypothetical protein
MDVEKVSNGRCVCQRQQWPLTGTILRVAISSDEVQEKHIHICAIVENAVGLDESNLCKLTDARAPVLAERTGAEHIRENC